MDAMDRRRFLKLTTLTGSGLAAGHLLGLWGREARALPAPNAVRFAIIGDFGETRRDQTFPVDQLGAMIRSWNPDFVVSVGDDNYILGEAATIDTNVGKNFTGYIYPKGTGYPEYYPYPAGAPTYNRFYSALGNHDYGDVADDFAPTPANIGKSAPYVGYFTNSLRGPQAPNTVITFADGAPGQTYDLDDSGDYACGSYAPFSEGTNSRFYDVRLGTAAGPSSVHLFVFDSNPATPYGRTWQNQTITGAGGCQATVLATQAAWLQQRLAASTARWKIVLFHHPPYYSGTGAADLQYEMMRWPFQAWGATAVITGHVHNYERLQMPDADANNQPVYGMPTIPYVVNGAGGFVPEQGFDPSFVVKGSQVRVENYGAQLVSADDDSISFLFYDIDGVLRDSFTLWNDATDAPRDVQFDAAEFVVGSNFATASLAVVRQGDLTQPLNVAFTTMDGTAKQGVNYVATAGTLAFAAGQSTATISVPLIQTIYAPGAPIPPTLAFSVLLSQPSTGTTLGFFASTAVVIQNNVETPLNDLDAFIDQSYLDVLARPATASEHTAARVWIGFGSTDQAIQDLAFLSHWRRAEWIEYLLTTSFTGNPATNAPVLNVGLVYALIYLNPVLNIAARGATTPPTYQDLLFWTTDWITQSGATPTDQLLTRVSRGFNQNVLEYLLDRLKTAPGVAQIGDPALNAEAFILGVYFVFGVKVANAADLAYWTPIVEGPEGRYAMLGQIAATSFDPPPVSGMTALNLAGTPTDLTVGNQLLALLSAVVAGLTRTQPTFAEFYYPYWQQVRFSNNVPVALTDKIYNILLSPEYAHRFALPGTPVNPPSALAATVTLQRNLPLRGRSALLRGTHAGDGDLIEVQVRGPRNFRTLVGTSPNWRARLWNLPERGGRLIVRVRTLDGRVITEAVYDLDDLRRRRPRPRPRPRLRA